MNYENHNSIVAAISIFTQQESQILGKPSLLQKKKTGACYRFIKTQKQCQIELINNNINNNLDIKEMTK